MKNLPKRSEIKTESPIEDILLRELKLLGFYPTTQFKVGNYRIDLAFPKHLLAIECDGKEWHSSQEQIERDQRKDKFLKENGWKVVRVGGSQIYKSADEIARLIMGIDNRYNEVNSRKSIYAMRSSYKPEKIDETTLSGIS